MQVGKHASRWFIGDLDGHLKDTAGDDVRVTCASRLGTDEHSIVRVAIQTVLLQLLLECIQPLGHQVDILESRQDNLMILKHDISKQKPFEVVEHHNCDKK